MCTHLLIIVLTLHLNTHTSQANHTTEQFNQYLEEVIHDNGELFSMEPKSPLLQYPDATNNHHDYTIDTVYLNQFEESPWLAQLEFQTAENYLHTYATLNTAPHLHTKHTTANTSQEPKKNEMKINCQGIEFGNHLTEDDNIENLQKLLALRKESARFRCCNKRELHWVEFTDHLNSHHCVGNDFVCPHKDCKKKYTQLSKAYHHAAVHQEPTILKCPLCTHTSKTVGELNTHVKTCLRPKNSDAMSISTFLNAQTKKYSHNCHSAISNTFKNWRSVKQYISKKYKIARSQYTCPTCNTTADCALIASSCFVKHWCNNFFVCPVCSLDCGDYQQLKDHDISRCTQNQLTMTEANTIHNQTPDSNTTGSMSPAMSSIEKIQKHIDDTIATMTCCTMPLGNWFAAQNHFALRHKIKTMCYLCPHCNGIYKTSAQALECYLAEQNERVFVCMFCKITVSGRQKLIDHVANICNQAPTNLTQCGNNTNSNA